MHKTIYIDIDEEITSIVDGLRNASAKEVVIVVPKRAMLIQSIVNLKLLKKEAERLKKEIVIATQDKLGKLLVEKAGIETEQKLENVSGKEVDFNFEQPETDSIGMELETQLKGKNRLENIGSQEFFVEKETHKIQQNFSNPENDLDKKSPEKLINTELVAEAGISLEKKKSRFSFCSDKNIKKEFDSDEMIKKMDITQKGMGLEINLKDNKIKKKSEKRKIFQMGVVEEDNSRSQSRVNKLEKYYNNKNNLEKPEKEFSVSKKSWKALVWFGILAVLVIALAAAYMFLPTAKIKIFVKTKVQSIDVDIKGDTSLSETNFQEGLIPAKLIVREEEVSKTFNATGKSGSSSQKAHGTVTLYNEYSSESQPLVTTTRLLSSDNKLFRLIKGVTIPGMTKVGEETKPGAIEAEVMADSSGEEFNIGATTFSIPGFQGSGSEKYAKIYAKSSKEMTGGGKNGNEVIVISESDITAARNEIAQELKNSSLENIKKDAGESMTILEDAINLADSTYVVSNSEGEAVKQFTLTGKTSVSAIVFGEEDFKKIASRNLLKAAGGSEIIADNSLKIEFGKSEVDFLTGILSIKANISGRMREDVDLDILKKGVAGKNEKELSEYLSIYSEIKDAEIEYHPAFLGSRVPSSEKRITIEVDSK